MNIKDILDKTNIKPSNEIEILEYIDDLQNRINKAIEYINYLYNNENIDYIEKEEILKRLSGKDTILRGEDIK